MISTSNEKNLIHKIKINYEKHFFINFEKDFLKENYSLIINKNNIEINVQKEKNGKLIFS